MFGGTGKNIWDLRVCFFMDWKVASKKCSKSVPEPSVLHYFYARLNSHYKAWSYKKKKLIV